VGIEGREITSMGVFQSSRGMRRTSVPVLVISLLAVFLVCLQLLSIGPDMSIPLLIVAILWTIMAISNIVSYSRLDSKDFNEGDMRQVMVLDTGDKDVNCVREVRRRRLRSGHGA